MTTMEASDDDAGDVNDIDEIFLKCEALKRVDPMWIVKMSMGMCSLDVVKELVANMGRAVVNIGDGLTLLHTAAQFGRSDWIVYLAGEMQHPTEVMTVVGETPLDQAAWKGHVSACMLLLKYGADVDCKTHLKYTPLHRCAFYNHVRLASLLVLAGADQHQRDENGQTAYEVAVAENNHDVATILKPMLTKDGKDITGMQYASNNPKHPAHRPEAREALFQLFLAEMDGEDEDPGSEDESDEDDDDDDDDEMDSDEEGDGEEGVEDDDEDGSVEEGEEDQEEQVAMDENAANSF